MMNCYFQGCDCKGTTKEHIPPRSFFPDGEKEQLLTVRSCEKHNNKKAKDDIYVLSHICINSSPKNRAREVFFNKVVPQLSFNENAMRKMLIKDAVALDDGTVKYRVDTHRFDDFFTALTCGILFKSNGSRVPNNYLIRHVYHNFSGENEAEEYRLYKQSLIEFYSGTPMKFMDFGNAGAKNVNIYAVKIFGVPNYRGSIIVVHEFFGTFKVTSMVTLQIDTAAVNKLMQSIADTSTD